MTIKEMEERTGMSRTWTVMWEGMAMSIPLVSMYFCYKSYSLAEDEIPLSWEGDSELTIRDDKMWRFLPFVLAHLALFAISIYSVIILGG